MSKGHGKKRLTAIRGTTTVEFALMLPLLASLGLVTVDLGRFAYAQIALSSAARAAADVAATTPRSTSNESQWREKVMDAARNEWLGSTGIGANRLELTVHSEPHANGLEQHAIHASYPLVLIIPWPGIPSSLQLEQRLVTRRYR